MPTICKICLPMSISRTRTCAMGATSSSEWLPKVSQPFWLIQATLERGGAIALEPLGTGIPQPPSHLQVAPHARRHRLPEQLRVVARATLGGLHHAYGFEEKAA